MKQSKILIVEDDQDIREMLRDFLEAEGYILDFAIDGNEAIDFFRKNQDYQLVLLDLMLPKKNGATILAEIRKESFIPVIIISAKDTDFDKSLILDLGADDYVAKPFSLVELNSRIKSLLRRVSLYKTKSEIPTKINFLDLTLDVENFSLEKNNEVISLTSTEFEIIKLFLMNPKKVFTKEAIYQAVWQERYFGDEHLVNVHMSRLREKLGEDSKNPQYIQTMWGIGYRLKE